MHYNSVIYTWPLVKWQFFALLFLGLCLIIFQTSISLGIINLLYPNFSLIIVAYVCVRDTLAKASLLAFIFGFFIEIFSFEFIGLMSLNLLVSVFVIYFLKRKINLYNYLFLIPTILLISIMGNYLIISPLMFLLVGYKIDLDSNLLFTLEASSTAFFTFILFYIFNNFLFKDRVKQ